MKYFCSQCKKPCKQLNLSLEEWNEDKTKDRYWKCNSCYYENIKTGIEEIKSKAKRN